jgi:hypothetical protein
MVSAIEVGHLPSKLQGLRSIQPRLRCYHNAMVLRSAASLLLLVCAAAFSQPLDPPSSNLPKSFHDPLLNITYFYPGRFIPAAAGPSAPANEPSESTSATPTTRLCAQSNLSASSISPVGTSVFVLSTIDNTCPGVLHGASTDLGAFTREQVLRQLKQYGDPVITQEPTHYTIDGHPAVITLASARAADAPGTTGITPPRITYAAKACLFGNVPVKPRKRSDPVDQPRHVLCFDFTTQQRDLLPLMFSFSMQFDNESPQPLVPGSALR